MASEIEILRNEIERCTKCELAQSRHHVIFGEGNPNGGIFIIGVAPGRDEDLQRRPFGHHIIRMRFSILPSGTLHNFPNRLYNTVLSIFYPVCLLQKAFSSGKPDTICIVSEKMPSFQSIGWRPLRVPAIHASHLR